MKSMKECCELIDDMNKSLSFNLDHPVEMNPHKPFYSPYRHISGNGGGYMPYEADHWEKAGKKDPYRENTDYYNKYGLNKSMTVEDAFESLIKGGPGSGRTGHSSGDTHEEWGAGGVMMNPDDMATHRAKQRDAKDSGKEMMANYEAREKKKKDEAEKKKKDEAKTKLRRDAMRLASYMKSQEGDDMKLFTTVEPNLIQEVKEDTRLSKSIESNEYHLDGRPGLAKSSWSDLLLQNTHGEQFSSDADKQVLKYLTTTGEIPLDDVNPSRQNPFQEKPEPYKTKSLPASDLNKAFDFLAKGDMPDMTPKDDGGGDDVMDESEETEEAPESAEGEAKKEEDKNKPKGAAKENPFDKSFVELEAVAKACKEYKNLDELSEEVHEKAKKKSPKKMHENSKGM